MLESADMELTPNVTMIFSNTSNCGAEKSTAGRGGCTYTVAPNTYVIVMSPELANTQWGNHILFHELAHTVGMGECEAEAYAHQFEEEELWSYPTCEEFGTP
jgi:galactokinase